MSKQPSSVQEFVCQQRITVSDLLSSASCVFLEGPSGASFNGVYAMNISGMGQGSRESYHALLCWSRFPRVKRIQTHCQRAHRLSTVLTDREEGLIAKGSQRKVLEGMDDLEVRSVSQKLLSFFCFFLAAPYYFLQTTFLPENGQQFRAPFANSDRVPADLASCMGIPPTCWAGCRQNDKGAYPSSGCQPPMKCVEQASPQNPKRAFLF